MAWKKIVLTGFGGPECLDLQTENTLPEPGSHEVRIRVLVTSAAFTDVMIRKGNSAPHPSTQTPGKLRCRRPLVRASMLSSTRLAVKACRAPCTH